MATGRQAVQTKLKTEITVAEICDGFVYNQFEGKGLYGLGGNLSVHGAMRAVAGMSDMAGKRHPHPLPLIVPDHRNDLQPNSASFVGCIELMPHRSECPFALSYQYNLDPKRPTCARPTPLSIWRRTGATAPPRSPATASGSGTCWGATRRPLLSAQTAPRPIRSPSRPPVMHPPGRHHRRDARTPPN